MAVILFDGANRIEMKRSQPNTRTNGLGASIPVFGKSKVKAAFDGSSAQFRVADTTPEFEIMLFSASNPADVFALVKLNPKSDRREIEVGRYGMISGVSTGFRKESVIPTTFEAVKTQMTRGQKTTIYRVKVVSPLLPGEYAFVKGGDYYDFGVDANAQNISGTSQQTSQTVSANTTNTTSANSTANNTVSTNSASSDAATPEITINADLDKVRAVIVRRFTRERFTLDKDQTSQLVSVKKSAASEVSSPGCWSAETKTNHVRSLRSS